LAGLITCPEDFSGCLFHAGRREKDTRGEPEMTGSLLTKLTGGMRFEIHFEGFG
jgi:hypothetical protein